MREPTPVPVRPWKVLDRRLLLAREPWVQVYQDCVQLPSGHVLEDYYRVVLPDFAVAVPVTAGGEFVMVRGYKHGLGRGSLSPPAGLLNPGEEPLVAAQRELLEETGYEAQEWSSLGTYVVDGNRRCGTMHVFLATNASPTRPPQEDVTEELSVELYGRDRLLRALAAGEFGTLAGAGAVSLALVRGLMHLQANESWL